MENFPLLSLTSAIAFFGLGITVIFIILDASERMFNPVSRKKLAKRVDPVYSWKNLWLTFTGFYYCFLKFNSITHRVGSEFSPLFDWYSIGDPRFLPASMSLNPFSFSMFSTLVVGILALLSALHNAHDSEFAPVIQMVYSVLEIFSFGGFFLQYVGDHGVQFPEQDVMIILAINFVWLHAASFLFQDSVNRLFHKKVY